MRLDCFQARQLSSRVVDKVDFPGRGGIEDRQDRSDSIELVIFGCLIRAALEEESGTKPEASSVTTLQLTVRLIDSISLRS
jgi:hypothetical protein